MCGGSRLGDAAGVAGLGLSPRVRGKPVGEGRENRTPGSIPACAGEACGGRSGPRRRTVYPRVCGGSLPRRRSASRRWGLSPRVRGKHVPMIDAHEGAGSIPACAGEALLRAPGAAPRGVYPRVCGGSPSGLSSTGRRAGLSPRVRGKRHIDPGLIASKGSIPACAGEAPPGITVKTDTGVYPRVCGGSVSADTIAWYVSGLSPRVRGKR